MPHCAMLRSREIPGPGPEGAMTRYLTTLPLLLTSASLPAEEPRLMRYDYTEPHMGTQFKIILYAADEALAKKAARAAFERVAALDACMSDYKPDSELMKLCAQAGGPPVKVSEELFFVLRRAQQVSELSGGAFDVT